MHYTWYDVEKEMLRETHAISRNLEQTTPRQGMDLVGFARVAAALTMVLCFAIPALS